MGDVGVVKFRAAGFDDELASAWHSVAGVHGQVNHDLMELSCIAHSRPEVLGDVSFKLDGFGKSVVDDLNYFLEQMAGLEQHALTLNAAGKGQDLLNHFGPAFGAGFNDREHALALIVAELLPQNFDRHENGREDVIEVVRNAAGQCADAFHALRAKELGLDFSFLANIRVDHEDRFGPPGIIEDQRPLALDNNRLITLGDVAGFAFPLAFFHHLFFRAIEVGAVAEKQFANRSRAVQEAIRDKIERLGKGRLARECAKLDPREEKALAEEGLGADLETWPE